MWESNRLPYFFLGGGRPSLGLASPSLSPLCLGVMTFMLGSNSGRKREEEKGRRKREEAHMRTYKRGEKERPPSFSFSPALARIKEKEVDKDFFSLSPSH